MTKGYGRSATNFNGENVISIVINFWAAQHKNYNLALPSSLDLIITFLSPYYIEKSRWWCNFLKCDEFQNFFRFRALLMLEILKCIAFKYLKKCVPFTTEWYEKQVKLIFKAHEQRRFWNFLGQVRKNPNTFFRGISFYF